MNQPLLLLKKNEDSKWIVTEDAEKQLQDMHKLIGVVSIAGNYNCGKSFLMNQLFELKQNCFTVGESRNATTKGIWMYAMPNKKDSRNLLVALDSEGLDDVMMGDQNYDRGIFILCILLSHCFMYNSTGAIRNSTIEDLRLVSELANRIKVKEKCEESDPNTYFGQHFPHLFLILRDISQDLKDIQGKSETPDQHLERVLALRPDIESSDRRILDYNAPRISIRNFFPRRNCHILPIPVEDFNKLRNLHILETDELSEEFRYYMNRVRDAVTKVAKTKAEEKGINGIAFLHIIKQCIQRINEDQVPCIDTAYSMAAKDICIKAKDESFAKYTENMNLSLASDKPVLLSELARFHEDSRAKAFAIYNERSWYGKGELERMSLQENISKSLTEYQKQNEQKWRRLCQKELVTHFSEILADFYMNKFQSDGCVDKFLAAKEIAISKYNSLKGLGPFKNEELQNYLKANIDDIEASIKQFQENIKHKAKLGIHHMDSGAFEPVNVIGTAIGKTATARIEPDRGAATAEASDSQGPKSSESKTKSGGVLATGIENAASTECLDDTYASGDIIRKLVRDDYIETIKNMKEETQVQFEREQTEMLRNLKARELEESSYQESGHESLAFDQAEARKRIEEDREKAKQQLDEKMSRYEQMLRYLKEEGSRILLESVFIAGQEIIQGFI